MRAILFFLLLHVTCIHAQQTYVTDKDIAYYPASVSEKDAYINSQCKLDFYYPKGSKNFATIVWFHGGGITGGRKEIPAALTPDSKVSDCLATEWNKPGNTVCIDPVPVQIKIRHMPPNARHTE